MISAATLRIKNDLNEIKPDDCIGTIGYVEQQTNDPLTVEACLKGQRLTPYEDHMVFVKMQFSNNYPISAPTITCTAETNNYGASIIQAIMNGCFTRNWNPTFTIKRILDIIFGIMRIDLEQIEQINEIEDLFIQ